MKYIVCRPTVCEFNLVELPITCLLLTRALLRLERTMNLLEGGKGGEGRVGERGWGGDGGRVGREGGEGTWGREGGWVRDGGWGGR